MDRLNGLRLANTLDVAAHEMPINVGHLKLLAFISSNSRGLDRNEALTKETHLKPTVDARIKYLNDKGLICPCEKYNYHDATKYISTARGKIITRKIKGKEPMCMYHHWLDVWIGLPISKRESPINVGILMVYGLIQQSPDTTVTELLKQFTTTKPTMISRLRWLEKKNLIERWPKYNSGGNGNPDYYRVLIDSGFC